MSSTVRSISRPRGSSPRTADDRFGVAPPPKRSRLPEVALGVLLVAVSALGGLWLFARSTERVEVLALSQDVARGEVVEVSDLEVVSIGTDDVVTVLGRNEVSRVEGQVAVADLAAGTLIVPSMVVPGDVIADGDGVIGVEVPVGQIPSSDLVRGDVVSVVLTPAPDDRPNLADPAVRAGEVLVESAKVLEVSPIGTSNALFVSLAMPADAARVVAVAASQGQFRLVKVPG